MEYLAENMSAVALSFIVPLSTMAALAIGCGDNRQHAHKQKMVANGKNEKRSSRSSKRHGSSRKGSHSSKRHSKSNGSVLAKPGSSSKAEQNLRSKSHHAKDQVKPGAENASNKASSAKDKGKHSNKEKAKESAKDAKEKAKEGAKHAKEKVKEGAKEVSKKTSSAKENVKAVAKDASKKVSSAKDATKQAIGSKTSEIKGSVIRNMPSAEKPRQKSEKHKEGSRYKSEPVACSDVQDVVLEPQQLSYNTTGGLQTITVRSKDNKRHAIKVKCSDNGLYRVNPVYTFVEPGKSVSLNVYRNNSTVADSKTDKLVLALAEVPEHETEPMNAFKEKDAKHPMLVMPLLVSGSNAARCVCVK